MWLEAICDGRSICSGWGPIRNRMYKSQACSTHLLKLLKPKVERMVGIGDRETRIHKTSGLQCRQILSDSDSDADSGLKISTPTPSLTPLRLQPNKRYSVLKGAIWCGLFLDFLFDCIQTGDALIQHPFALTADAAGRG